MKWMSSPSISVMNWGRAFSVAPAPVIATHPIARQILHQRRRHTLRVAGDGLALRPSGLANPPAHIDRIRIRKFNTEGADVSIAGHKDLLLSQAS
jgi:hypothetical protein